MARLTVIRKNRYLDSVFLMQVAHRLKAHPGVTDASALLATEANRRVLAGLGYGQDEEAFGTAGPNDLVLALTGDPGSLAEVAADPEAWLARGAGSAPGGATGGATGGAAGPRTLAAAVAARPEANVALISVPGEHAAREARAALQAGLNVFLFSSNVSVADELDLKRTARDRGLIVMGPDCGTAFLGGAGLGFANAVRRGPVGVVGPTGTGLQEFSSLLHQAGSGLSSGIGTGGRDLSDAIGGLSTLAGLDALEADPATHVITVLAKPPGRIGTAALLARLARCRKPIVLCLLGAPTRPEVPAHVRVATTVDQAVQLALALTGLAVPALASDPAALRRQAQACLAGLRPEQRHLRGLFAGGTLCYQTQAILREAGLEVHSNAPLEGMPALADPCRSEGDTVVDLGAEQFVEGRPHPMIDATLRRQRLLQEGEDPTVAILLLDFILGAIASRDPVGELLDAIRQAQASARARGGQLVVVASVCGTDEDAQDLAGQRRALEEAGVQGFQSHAQAAAFCREAMLLLRERQEAQP